MFWDNVAGVYDIFVNVVNRRAHRALKEIMAGLIGPEDDVLECACGTGFLTAVIAERCRTLTATDFSRKMLQKAEKNCAKYGNVSFRTADITSLEFPDCSFDVTVAGNVIHLLDDPMQALRELDRVTKSGGKLIIPTYINREHTGKTGGFVSAAEKAGADFKRQFTSGSYRQFFLDAGYGDVEVTVAEGRIPCAVAVMSRTGN